MDRVHPPARESRRHSRCEPQRRREHEPLQRASLLIVVAGLLRPRMHPAIRLVFFAAVGEPRGQNRSVAGELAVVLRGLEQHLERIAWLEIVLEVDLTAEELGERDRQLHALAGRIDGRDERRVLAVNPAANGDDARFLVVQQHFGGELLGRRSIAIDDAQKTVGVDLILELLQESVDGQHQTVRAFGAQETRVEHRARGLYRRLDEGCGQFVLAEDRFERGLAGHDGFDGLGLDRQHDIGAHARRRRRLVRAPARRRPARRWRRVRQPPG